MKPDPAAVESATITCRSYAPLIVCYTCYTYIIKHVESSLLSISTEFYTVFAIESSLHLAILLSLSLLLFTPPTHVFK